MSYDEEGLGKIDLTEEQLNFTSGTEPEKYIPMFNVRTGNYIRSGTKAAEVGEEKMPETREGALLELQILWEKMNKLDAKGEGESEKRNELRIRESRIRREFNIEIDEIKINV